MFPYPKAAPAKPALETDLKTLADAANDAAKREAAQWFYFVTIMITVAAIVGSTTHRVLFLEEAVRVPFLGVELPLLGFYVVVPAIFVVLHFYTLAQLGVMARKLRAFLEELDRQVGHDAATREKALQRLDSFSVLQLLVSERYGTRQATVRLMAWTTLVVAPVLLLLFFQLRFLPYHSEWITWWHRGMVLLDLALIWWLWPTYVGRLPARYWHLGAIRWGAAGLVAVFSVLVATLPDESAELQGPIVPIRGWLFDGPVDEDSQRPTSPFSRRLVLPDEDLVPEGDAALAAVSRTRVLRGRDLRYAVLDRADLRKADFTGADLTRASLVSAKLAGATMDRAKLARARIDHAEMQGASLLQVDARASSFAGTNLQKAVLRGAKLSGGAVLDGANAEAADFRDADLRQASLEHAVLEAANFGDATMQAAVLRRANLERAILARAQLQGAVLYDANLKAAVLAEAQLQGAALDSANMALASLENAQLQGASLANASLHGAYLLRTRMQGAMLRNTWLQAALLVETQLQGASVVGSSLAGAWLERTQLQGARLDGVDLGAAYVFEVAVWRMSAVRSRIDDAEVRFVNSRRRSIPSAEWLSGIPEGPLRDQAAQRLEVLTEEEDPPDFAATLAALQAAPAARPKEVVRRLGDLACSDSDLAASFIAQGILAQIEHRPYWPRRNLGPERHALAARLDSLSCSGRVGLPAEARERLRLIAAGAD